ncbi:MAG: single-stranded DNA-binding protein [Verrucomicrobia bacterium]|jgi:single-strand DNA-binding protein|nr:single-stranded DNA-binding protein [Verrucomicrobiota bacterium]
MASFNKVILVGNITRDPELRYTPSGTAIAKLSLAVNRSWRTETGETREEVTFVDVDAFGKQAETIGQYLRKGRPILVEGRLKMDQWEDKQTGQKRSRLGVVLEVFRFLDSSQGRAEGGAPPPAAASPAAAPPAQQSYRSAPPAAAAASGNTGFEAGPPPEEDDVPF